MDNSNVEIGMYNSKYNAYHFENVDVYAHLCCQIYQKSKSMSFANEFFSFVLNAHRDLVGQSSVSYNKLYLVDTKIPES